MDMKDIIEEMRTKIIIREHDVLHTATTTYPGTYANYDDTWDLERFKETFEIKIVSIQGNDLEFDLIGVEPPLVNAIRRILLSEVPSMAIEKVLMYNNTSIIQDEVLSHRLGLIPLKAKATMFENVSKNGPLEGTEEDTLEYELKVKCTKKPNAAKDASNPDELYLNHKVLSKEIKWVPRPGQAALLKESDVKPVHDDILIAKLRPGHEIDLKLLAVKGIGRDHAKFSPVCTASYRLHPEITLLRKVKDEDADRLQKCFSEGVIDVVEKGNGTRVAQVGNARYDSCSRNVFMYDDLKDAVKMTKIKNHFIFSVESVGAYAPDVLVLEAIKVLETKCTMCLAEMEKIDPL